MKNLFYLIVLLPFIAFAQPRMVGISGYRFDTTSAIFQLSDTTHFTFTTGGGGDPFVVVPHTFDSSIARFFNPPGGTNSKIYTRKWQTYSGKNVVMYTEYLSGTTQQVTDFRKEEFQYDNNGNRTFYAVWQWKNNMWEQMSSEIKTFDANNNTTLYERRSYQPVDTLRTRYYYTAKVLDSLENSRYTKGWIIEDKGIYTHVAANTSVYLALVNKGTYWDTAMNRFIYTYDVNRKILSFMQEIYNKPGGYWAQDMAMYYEYDGNGNKIKDSVVRTALAPPNPINYQNYSKREYTYNAHRQLTSDSRFTWKAATGQWQPFHKDVFYYQDTTTGVASVQHPQSFILYPNPASTTLHIDGIANGHYSIYTTDGKLADYGRHNGNIRIEQLPAGNYILLLDGGSPAQFIKE